MLTTLTLVFNRYMSCDFQKFTEKYILARGMFQLMDEFNKEDEKKIKSFEDKVSTTMPVSLYKLDRDINPTKGEFKAVANKVIYTIKGQPYEFSENQIQHALCQVIRECHEIVMRNMKKYQLEQPVNSDSGETFDIGEFLKK